MVTSTMTRTRFCEIQARRGYTVENLGLVTFLYYTMKDGSEYTAMWFWNEDGTEDEANHPFWTIVPPRKGIIK